MTQGSAALDKGWEAFAQGRDDEGLSEAMRFVNSTDSDIARDANKLAGRIYFDRQDFKTSLGHFMVSAENTEDADHWFNVMSAAVNAGEIETARDAFKKTLDYNLENPALPMTMSPLNVHLYFAFSLCKVGEYGLALELANEIKPVYEQAHITDDTYLFTRGIPALYKLLDTAQMAFEGLGQTDAMKIWMEELAGKLDDDGREAIERILHPKPFAFDQGE